ncbi:MAG TPA: lamin tail domain-containing protein [Vulgatibacter sp.]|nr:lamin tail domain-containing protein [Vulgatibacter sp.]
MYSDISLVAGAELIGSGADTTMVDLTFANGFEFPFFGATYDTVRISTDGFLTFDTAASTASTNTALPNTTNARVHLAPFWDNLHTRDSGRVYAAEVGADYVIQWTNMSMTTGSRAASGGDPAEEHNLNFQVVLHADGTFEYRYGMMLGLPGGVTNASCHPNTCENEANGSAATIGYQVPGGGAGYQLHFGGGSPGAGNFPYGGGLSNRSFKFGAYSGSGSMVVTQYDTASYKLCAVSGTFLECTSPVTVTTDWRIVSFDAPFAVPLGSPVPLTWVTQGGGSIELKATQGGTTTFLPVSTLDPAGDSYSDTLLGDTDYTLELHSFGRVKSISKTVLEQMVSVSLTSSHVEALPGEDVTLTWDVVSLSGGTPVIDSNFVGQLFEHPSLFQDIVGDGGTQVIGPGITAGSDPDAYQDLIFDPAFTFPYFGTDYTQVRIGLQGFLSFDPTITGDNFSNKQLPYSTGEMGKIALAPYWGDLQTRAATNPPAGGVYWKYEPAPASGPPYYVIQYDHMMAWQNSTLDATFQVVLFADGSFEYRYGTMLPHADNSAGYMARGGAKTIGYQAPGTSIGSTLHYAPWGSTASAAQVFPGGLEGRTFRYDGPAPLSGSKVVNPTRTTTYTLCAQEGTYQECHEVTVVVPSLGDVIITEVMPGDPGDQWFEVRNVKSEAVNLEGWTIVGETGSHVINGPLVIPAFGYATFAASANPGFVPTYVYGTDVDLGTELTGRAALEAGSLTISEVEWDGTWGLLAGSHLSLDGAFHKRGVGSNPQEAWCDAAAPTPGASGAGCAFDDYDLERFANVPFQDIRASGTTESTMAADSGRIGVNLPFVMPIFDSTATQVWVDSNGWISFAGAQPSTSHFPPSSLPRGATVAPAGPLLAGFWDDLGCAQNNGLPWDFQHQSLTVGGMEMMVLQWNNYKRCSNDGGTTFQIQLWENGDMAVVFDLISAEPGSAAWEVYNGKSAWIGLEGPDRTRPITALYKEIEPLEGRSFLFMRK